MLLGLLAPSRLTNPLGLHAPSLLAKSLLGLPGVARLAESLLAEPLALARLAESVLARLTRLTRLALLADALLSHALLAIALRRRAEPLLRLLLAEALPTLALLGLLAPGLRAGTLLRLLVLPGLLPRLAAEPHLRLLAIALLPDPLLGLLAVLLAEALLPLLAWPEALLSLLARPEPLLSGLALPRPLLGLLPIALEAGLPLLRGLADARLAAEFLTAALLGFTPVTLLLTLMLRFHDSLLVLP